MVVLKGLATPNPSEATFKAHSAEELMRKTGLCIALRTTESISRTARDIMTITRERPVPAQRAESGTLTWGGKPPLFCVLCNWEFLGYNKNHPTGSCQLL